MERGQAMQLTGAGRMHTRSQATYRFMPDCVMRSMTYLAYDRNSDDELSPDELIRGLAFERKFRDELGIKGCDQGGAMSLINRGDANADRQLASDELAAVDLDAATMKFDRNENQRLSVSELAEYLADRRMRLGMTPSDQLRGT